MAELHADTREEPMISGPHAVQLEKPSTAPLDQGMDPAGSHGTRNVEDASNSGDHASQCSPGGDLPAAEGGSEVACEGVESAKKKTKRSKKKKKSTRNITGFEEFYADCPVTPAEALEERKEAYNPSRPFSDRIEECIQRYRARRRLCQQRTNMFNKYLFLGGIDSSPRQFTGMVTDKEALAEADSNQIRSMTAVDFVGGSGGRFFSTDESENWDVDFEAVVKGFLSRTMTDWYMYDAEANQMAADLIKNFLNYILMHNVCPEYTTQLIAARHICDIAPFELRCMHELMLEFPGTFNTAARRLFCEGKVNDLGNEENSKALTQFRLTTLVWALSEKAKLAQQNIFRAEDPTKIHVISTVDKTYQVINIERPRKKFKKMVDKELAAVDSECALSAAGFIRVIPAIIAHGWGNLPRPDEVDFSDAEPEDFVLEDELLAKLEVGMKLHVTVCNLNVGIRFIKEVHDVRVSFDTFLPQYLMTTWKEPVVNDRPPPSVNNLNAEENWLGEDMKVDD